MGLWRPGQAGKVKPDHARRSAVSDLVNQLGIWTGRYKAACHLHKAVCALREIQGFAANERSIVVKINSQSVGSADRDHGSFAPQVESEIIPGNAALHDGFAGGLHCSI